MKKKKLFCFKLLNITAAKVNRYRRGKLEVGHANTKKLKYVIVWNQEAGIEGTLIGNWKNGKETEEIRKMMTHIMANIW